MNNLVKKADMILTTVSLVLMLGLMALGMTGGLLYLIRTLRIE